MASSFFDHFDTDLQFGELDSIIFPLYVSGIWHYNN
jgi:hypothetical protein